MKGIQHISDHEMPLAIGLLKGISWVSLVYNFIMCFYWY